MSGTRPTLLMIGAAGVLVSAYLHFYLYFWGGYRGISVDRVAGIDISRSFALNAVAGLVMLACLIAFLLAEQISRMMGVTGRAVISRLLGIILAALAVQFVIDGVEVLLAA